MSISWLHPDVKQDVSSIQGKGIFAGRDFLPGETVQRMGGKLLSEAKFRLAMAELTNYNSLQVGEDEHLLDPTPGLGGMNHSCDSNCWMLDATTVLTRREIVRGDELTVDYALFSTLDLPLIDGNCSCGCNCCRHTPRGSHWQIFEVQERYAGHFSPFINKRIKASGQCRAHN